MQNHIRKQASKCGKKILKLKHKFQLNKINCLKNIQIEDKSPCHYITMNASDYTHHVLIQEHIHSNYQLPTLINYLDINETL
jgi:hypothetical protein